MKTATPNRKSLIIVAAIIIFSFIFVHSFFIQHEPKISLTQSQLQAELHRQGRPVRTGLIPADSSGVAAIKSRLEKQSGKWSRNWINYAPILVVKSDTFYLNFHKNLLILNYRRQDNSGTYTQVVSNLTEKEFDHDSKLILGSLVESPPEADQR